MQSLGITALAFSPNGSVFAVANSEQSGAGSTGVVRCWAFEWDDRELARLVSNGPVAALALSANGKFLATAAADGVARVIAVADGNQLASIPHAGVKSLSLSTDGSLLATAGEDKTSRLWSVKDSREVVRLTHENAISAVAVSSNGNRLSSVSKDGTLQSVAVAGTGKVSRVTAGGPLESSAFSPNGSLLVFVSSDGAHVMHVPEGRPSGEFTYAHPEDDENLMSAIAISPDGKFAVLGYRNGLELLRRVQDSKDVARFEGTGAAAFSHDGKLLATGAMDGVVRIIGIPDGRELTRIKQRRGVNSVALSDSGLLAMADDLGTVRIWSTKLDAMLQRLCQSNGLNLSWDEWTRSGYFNDLSWRPVCVNWATPK